MGSLNGHYTRGLLNRNTDHGLIDFPLVLRSRAYGLSRFKMANHIQWDAFFFSSFVLFVCDCKPLDGYKFPVYTTESCPRNQTEWSERSSAINCTESNGYLCLPSEDLTELLEFCYFDYQIPIAKGLCMFLRKRDSFIDDYSCRNFVEGCPNSTYRINEAYKYRSCVSIGNGCFLDDPTCVRTTATYKVINITRTTASIDTLEKTKHERNYSFWIITILGFIALVLIPIVIMMYCMKIKVVYEQTKQESSDNNEENSIGKRAQEEHDIAEEIDHSKKLEKYSRPENERQIEKENDKYEEPYATLSVTVLNEQYIKAQQIDNINLCDDDGITPL